MAGDFFYRECDVKSIQKSGKEDRLRGTAWVTVKSGGDVVLPKGLTGFDTTYGGNRKAAPILNSVKMTLEGKAGSLRRCEVAYTCFDKDSFEELEKQLEEAINEDR